MNFLKIYMFFPQDTKELCLQIYCKKNTIRQAITNSSKMEHVVRRLMTGVFKPSQIMDCTPTGQPWRAGGTEQQQAKVHPLHPRAVRAIVGMCCNQCLLILQCTDIN